MRLTLATAAGLALLLLGASPAAPPNYPLNFITVDELKALLDKGAKVDIIDVRHWDAYVETHIKGARAMPLQSVPARANEISRTGLVVFY